MTFGTQKQLPDWQLERFALGELPDEEMKAVREALAGAPELRERMAELERSDAAILAEYPAEAMAARLNARLAERESASSRRFLPRGGRCCGARWAWPRR